MDRPTILHSGSATSWILLWGCLAGGCSDSTPSEVTTQLREYARKFSEHERPLPVVSFAESSVPAVAWLEDLSDVWQAHEDRLRELMTADLVGACFPLYSTLPEYARIESARISIQRGGTQYWQRLDLSEGALVTGKAHAALVLVPYLYPSYHDTLQFYNDLLSQILRYGNIIDFITIFRSLSIHPIPIVRSALGRALIALDAPVIAGLLYEEGAVTCAILLTKLRMELRTEEEVQQYLPALDDLWKLATKVEEGQMDWPSLGKTLAAIGGSELGDHGMLLGLDWKRVSTLF